MPYKPVKRLLIAALGAALAFAALNRSSLLSVGLVVILSVLVLLWIIRNLDEVKRAHELGKVRGGEYIACSAQPWRKRPHRLIAPAILTLVGAICLVATFSEPRAPSRGFLKQFFYALVGPTATSVLAAFAAAYFLSTAFEAILGAYLASEA